MPIDYLNERQGNIGALGQAAGMAALFYGPVIPMATKIVGGAAKAAGRGMWGAVRGAGKSITKKGYVRGPFRSGLGLAGKVLDQGKKIGKFGGRVGRVMDTVGRNPGLAIGGALGAISVLGAVKGAMARAPVGETYTSTVSFDESMSNFKGLSPNNLGATGDLTLALHNRR